MRHNLVALSIGLLEGADAAAIEESFTPLFARYLQTAPVEHVVLAIPLVEEAGSPEPLIRSLREYRASLSDLSPEQVEEFKRLLQPRGE